jgi:hypothetical protein
MSPKVAPGALVNGDALTQLAQLCERSPKFQADVDRLCRLAAGAEKDGYSRSTGPLQHHWVRSLKEKRTRHKHVYVYIAGCKELAHQCFRLPDLWPCVHDLVGRRLGGEETFRLALPRMASAPPAWAGHVASKIAAHVTEDNTFGTGTVANRQAFQRQVGPMASAWLATFIAEHRSGRRTFIL